MVNNPYQCPECSASFPTEAALERHQMMAHSESRFTCDVCGMIFTTGVELETHRRAEHAEITTE